MGWRGLKEEGLLSPWFSWVGHWPLNRDLSEAWQGCPAAGSKAALWRRAESNSDQGASLSNYKAGDFGC